MRTASTGWYSSMQLSRTFSCPYTAGSTAGERGFEGVEGDGVGAWYSFGQLG